MVKDKLQNFQAKTNFVETEDSNMRDIAGLYESSVRDINTTETLMET